MSVIHTAEQGSSTYREFNDIQEEWKQIGFQEGKKSSQEEIAWLRRTLENREASVQRLLRKNKALDRELRDEQKRVRTLRKDYEEMKMALCGMVDTVRKVERDLTWYSK